MIQLKINNVGEELTNVLMSAGKLTPASILAGIVGSNNTVNSYLADHLDIDELVSDLLAEHETLLENHPQIETNTIAFLNQLGQDHNTPDRYITIMRFINMACNTDLFQSVIKNTIGKYLKFKHFQEDMRLLLPTAPNMVWEVTKVTVLDEYGDDLTAQAIAGELDPIIGRDEEVQRMVQVLCRQTKSNPILLGDAGVGKTALVEKLAQLLINKEVPHSLVGMRIVTLNMASILSDPAVESVMMALVEAAYQEKVILFIDEVHLINNDKGKIANLLKPAMARGRIKLIGATTHDEFKVFDKDEAIQRRFQPIIINEPSQTMTYKILQSKAEGAEKFHNVLIPNETLLRAITLSNRYVQNRQQPDKAIDLVEEAASRLRATLESRPQEIIEKERLIADLRIQIEILEVAAHGNITERMASKINKLQEKCEVLDEELVHLNYIFKSQRLLLTEVIKTKESLAANKANHSMAIHKGNFAEAIALEQNTIPALEEQLKTQEDGLIEMASTADENLIGNVVVPIMVERVIETITGIPVSAQEDDIGKYRTMDVELKKIVHGQDAPIDQMAAAIKRSKAGLSDAERPLGSFLCLGPTGVGKTYLAQKLTEFMFKTDAVLKRFDMSEYSEGHSIARLFGSPPGYVGHNEGGQLTEAIRRNPYSVILFDEIEKAHPRVFDAFLQLLDSGRMTDGKGNEINFKNTVIIMTSNVGSHIIHAGLERGSKMNVIEQALGQELTKHFRPEFLNRFDAKLLFNALSFEDVIRISESELIKLGEKLSKDNELDLNWHPAVAVAITTAAYDITDGARPVKRYINDNIISVLTDNIMNGDIVRGDTIYLANAGKKFELFSVDAEMLAVLKEAEKVDTEPKKKKKKKKKHTEVLTAIVLDKETPETPETPETELGD